MLARGRGGRPAAARRARPNFAHRVQRATFVPSCVVLGCGPGVLMAVRDLTGNHSQQPVIRRSLRLFTSLNLKNAADGNLAYLRSRLLPQLRELFRLREASPEFIRTWGEFKFIVGNLRISTREARNRSVRGAGGRKNAKSAQLKWFLHFRREGQRRGWTRNRANKHFSQLVCDLVNGKRELPEGFNLSWFQSAACTTGKGERIKYVASLPETLKRAGTDPRRAKLLASPPEADPAIPPVDVSVIRKGV